MLGDATISGGFISITPQSPTYLAGYTARQGTHTNVEDDLEANALIITPALSARRPPDPRPALRSGGSVRGGRQLPRVAAGIAPAALLMAASHTHFAPAVFPEKPLLGRFNADYADFLRDRVFACSRTARQARRYP